MRYQVKFTQDDGTVVYGIADNYSDIPVKQGFLLINDAVFPVFYEVPENRVQDIDMGTPPFYDWHTNEWSGGSELDQFVFAEWDKQKEISDKIDGVKIGKLFSVGVADGYAYYVVTKVNKKTCDISWRGFSLDRYTDRHFGWGGRFNIEEIERFVGMEDFFRNRKAKKA